MRRTRASSATRPFTQTDVVAHGYAIGEMRGAPAALDGITRPLHDRCQLATHAELGLEPAAQMPMTFGSNVTRSTA
jgi:hypothetical protein